MDRSPPGSSVRGFSRQERWSGLPCPPPGDVPDQELNLCLLCLLHRQADVPVITAVITPLLHLPPAPPGKPEKHLIPPFIMYSGSENRLLSKNWRRGGDFSQRPLIPAFCSFALDLFRYTGQAASPRAAYDLIPTHTGLSPPEALAGQSPQTVRLPSVSL